MAEYIEREALLNSRYWAELNNGFDAVRARIIIGSIPSADVVSQAVFDQVKWERDTALATLKEHGIGLAEKADVVEVVRCKKCVHYNTSGCADGFGWCNWYGNGQISNNFCSFGERSSDNV